MARGKSSKKGKGSKGFNSKNSELFLEQNSNKSDVITLPSGLQYTIIEECDGHSPDKNSTVTVHQRIKLVDETIIADTYKKNSPESFPMSEAIEGFYEGLKMMSIGSRYRFFIPPELAWGSRGAGSKIGPFAVIIIDCRLISIE
jgi:FKBP-type peptidyl-prolyl cis-trans isomerase FkpA